MPHYTDKYHARGVKIRTDLREVSITGLKAVSLVKLDDDVLVVKVPGAHGKPAQFQIFRLRDRYDAGCLTMAFIDSLIVEYPVRQSKF